MFVWQIRVYWEDTDAGGVVYHSRYLNFFERARTEWLRSRGVDQGELASRENLVFAIRKMDLDFHAPARMDDELEASVAVSRAGGTRLEMRQELRLQKSGELLCAADVTAACLSADRFRPVKTPRWLREQLGFEQ